MLSTLYLLKLHMQNVPVLMVCLTDRKHYTNLMIKPVVWLCQFSLVYKTLIYIYIYIFILVCLRRFTVL